MATLIVGVSFMLFAIDEFRGASKYQIITVEDPDGSSAVVQRDTRSGVRKAIDDASHALVKPFRDAIDSSSAWVQRGVPTLFGLIVYGFGLGFLARYVRSRA